MDTRYCKNCLWGIDCPDQECGCEYFTPLENETEVIGLEVTTEYIYDWQNYISHWNDHDKWGDLFDI